MITVVRLYRFLFIYKVTNFGLILQELVYSTVKDRALALSLKMNQHVIIVVSITKGGKFKEL